MQEKAMTLQEAADVLGLSYRTVFERRYEIGFRLPGSRIWRVWPSAIANLCKPRNNLTRLTLQVGKENTCQSDGVKKPASGGLISARQTANALDALLARKTEKRRRSTTTA